jgi:hypothetical protein
MFLEKTIFLLFLPTILLRSKAILSPFLTRRTVLGGCIAYGVVPSNRSRENKFFISDNFSESLTAGIVPEVSIHSKSLFDCLPSTLFDFSCVDTLVNSIEPRDTLTRMACRLRCLFNNALSPLHAANNKQKRIACIVEVCNSSTDLI